LGVIENQEHEWARDYEDHRKGQRQEAPNAKAPIGPTEAAQQVNKEYRCHGQEQVLQNEKTGEEGPAC